MLKTLFIAAWHKRNDDAKRQAREAELSRHARNASWKGLFGLPTGMPEEIDCQSKGWGVQDDVSPGSQSKELWSNAGLKVTGGRETAQVLIDDLDQLVEMQAISDKSPCARTGRVSAHDLDNMVKRNEVPDDLPRGLAAVGDEGSLPVAPDPPNLFLAAATKVRTAVRIKNNAWTRPGGIRDQTEELVGQMDEFIDQHEAQHKCSFLNV
jgi:hypothetical protein